jgi:hypothetical protein
MAVIEATRPAFWVQLIASTQPSAKPANSNWQLAISQNQPHKTFSAFLCDLCGKWFSLLRRQKAGRP